MEWVIATPREWELSAEAGEPGWEVSALGPRVLAIRALDRVTRQVVPFRAVGDPSPWLGF